MNPEERKEYNKKWYSENKESHLKKQLKPITCECGFESTYCNLKRHQKSKLHEKRLYTKTFNEKIEKLKALGLFD